MSTTMSALNRILCAKEKRSFWHRRIFSVLMLIFLGLFLVTLFTATVFAEQVEYWIRTAIPATQTMPSLVVWMRRLGGMFVVLLAVIVIYRFAPARKLPIVSLLPGSIFFFVSLRGNQVTFPGREYEKFISACYFNGIGRVRW